MVARIIRLITRLFFMTIIEISRRFTRHDTYVVAGMLFMRNTDPIDSWSFFRWLQEHNIPSRYVVKQEDEFYQKNIKGKEYKDIVVIADYNNILYHVKLWIYARAFVTEWNLTSKTMDMWLKKLPDMRYVLLQHGIIGTQTSDILSKGLQLFNDINVSSQKEKEIVESLPDIKRDVCFVAGLPRYDFLHDESVHSTSERILFIMFTWRDYHLTASIEDIKKTCYWKGVEALLCQKNIDRFKRNNIKVVLALHHSMPCIIPNLEKQTNVIIAKQKDIKYWISHAHGYLTDFSSVSFDFLFLNKPVIYWIPDFFGRTPEIADVKLEKKVLSAMERRKDFFNTADTLDDVMKLIDKYSTNGFVLEPEKVEAAKHWFDNQSDFSRRVYEEIEHRIQKSNVQR